MKIQVSDGGHNIRILLPTQLVFSRLTAKIGGAAIEKYVPECGLTAKQIEALFAEFRRLKSNRRHWELADVQCSDGQIVKVIL